MKKYNLLNHKGYPMYQTVKNKITSIDDQYEIGQGVLTMVSDQKMNIGDALGLAPYTYTISSIEEERSPRGNHGDGKIFYKVKCDYIKPIAQ